MQNNSTTTVHYGANGVGSKTLVPPMRASAVRLHLGSIVLHAGTTFHGVLLAPSRASSSFGWQLAYDWPCAVTPRDSRPNDWIKMRLKPPVSLSRFRGLLSGNRCRFLLWKSVAFVVRATFLNDSSPFFPDRSARRTSLKNFILQILIALDGTTSPWYKNSMT